MRDISLEIPLVAYARARITGYTLEHFLLESLYEWIPDPVAVRLFQTDLAQLKEKRGRKRMGQHEFEIMQKMQESLLALIREDSAAIASGNVPLGVLRPESPLRHIARLPQLIRDSYSIYRRRLHGKTTEFDAKSKDLLADVPRYYRRNFHYQSSGYLSKRSAEVYDHQVELLFRGGADAMRRLILRPLLERFGNTKGEGLRFLEIGAGTGSATRFVRLVFPKAKIVALDLSDPYLKVAQRKLKDFTRIDFMQGDGAKLPFKDQEFDAVYSVFLLHELPESDRREVLAESMRVLRAGGVLACVDSLQTGDDPLFDEALERFPKEFHEPFYRNYISTPLDGILTQVGLHELRSATGFTSKLCWGVRN